jgi:hypothetical protein
MAYALVGTFTSSLSSTAAFTSLTRTPAAGDGAVIVFNYQLTTAPMTISSLVNQASTAIPFTEATFNSWNQGAAVGFGQRLLWVPAFPGGTTAITLNTNTGSDGGGIIFTMNEYSGLTTSLTIDAQNGQTQVSSTGAANEITSGNATPVGAASGGMVFGLSGSYSAFESNTAGTGFGNYVAPNSGAGEGAMEDKRITSNASVAATFTAATVGNTYSTQMIVIDELASSGPVQPSTGALSLVGQTAGRVVGSIITPGTMKEIREAMRSIFLPAWKRELAHG